MSAPNDSAPGGKPDALRPERLGDFGGQDDVVRELGIVLGAAAVRGELCDHVLLSGPPGLGKTSLAHIIARELNVPIVATSGPAVEKPADLTSVLSALPGPCVVFVDEIHRLPRGGVEEVLYPAMEDGMLDFIIGEGTRARAVRLPLKPFVLVGATTQVGMLSAPLRDRFGFVARLRLYDDEALATIVMRSAAILGLDLDMPAARVIALRSRGTPRVANAWLRRVRDVAQMAAADGRGDGNVDEALALEALEAFGVDALGLDRTARELLTALATTFRGGPVGLNTLAAVVGEAPGTVEEVYEPHMLRAGLLARTRQGRVATLAAYEHLGLEATAVALSVAESPAGSEQPRLELELDDPEI